MTTDSTAEIERLLDRLTTAQAELENAKQGLASARDELVARVYERLRRLSQEMFHQSFPRLEAVHQTRTLLHESLLRIIDSLAAVEPPTVVGFFDCKP